ncbi:MAG: Multi-sensor hybrid histidine kinase [Planctomycetaceae bacterium]|nr:Multi-sensor hybrid histidine kinase [Planctomycetaceae bacterium]
MPQPIRVLIVEDSANDADLMLSELRRGGFDSDSKRVRTADELRAALSQGSWDVVLSDFSLPGFGAAAALEMAREMAADIPFIVVSGSVGEEVAVEMMRAGANDYVLKHAMARLGPIVSRELRESKKRQAAERLSQNVLNSLSSHIAVLDQQGTIVAVNASWKLFAARHGALAEIGPGSHYLTISHLAHGPYADAAPLVADGFAKVLAGELPQFVLEYQCRAKSPTKWFLLHTTPLGTEQGGAVVSHTDITARKEAEEAMRDSDSRTQFILETSLDCIITIDSQGKITEFNPAAEKTFGYSRKSVLGLAIVDLLIPSVFREPHLRGFDHFLKTGEGPILGQRVEVTALRQDGTEFPVELTVTAVHTRGKPEFTAFLRDISERKQAEMTLRDSEERYRTLLDRIPLPLFVYDRETLQYLTVNQAAVANYGYSHDEFLQMKVTDIRPSEDVPELLDALTRTGESYEKRGIWRHRKKNGTIIQVEIAAHSLDLAGRPACIILANDVTDGLQADAEVRRTSNLLKAVADSTPDAIFVKDRQGRYLLFNPAASRFVGLPVEEVLGRDDSQLFDPVGARFVMERDRQVMDSGQTETKEERLTAAGTTRV